MPHLRPKIALVHELLTMKGGAEKVLRILANMFPDAPIYTLLYDEEKLGDWFPKHRIRTSTIQKSLQFKAYSQLSIINSQFPYNHHLYLNSFPRAVEAWDFREFDLVISSSSAFAHGIITNGAPRHISYVHSPARYLWDRTHDVVDRSSTGLLGPLKRWYLEHTFHKLRIWDSESADRPDVLLAASKAVARRIELYWRREGTVLTPPFDDEWYTPLNNKIDRTSEPSYVVISTLVPYKQIDLVIAACNVLKRPLTIIGDGPDYQRLKNFAGPTVQFLGYQ